MIRKGMNIEPLPTLELINGDSENAKEFLGKTAYYDPNEQHIVLYTEGRHPKDIVRSYAHEMIHHICLLYTSPSPRDRTRSRMPSSA